VKSEDLFEEVLPDWAGFKRTELVKQLCDAVIGAVREILARLYAERIKETTEEALTDHATQLASLEPGERVEVADVTETIARNNPLVAPEVLSMAVEGIIESKAKATPYALIQRIMTLPQEDIEGLQRLLDEWSVRDAITVLDEIGRRIKVVEALQKLMGEADVDELHVIHPLVTQARWLFGPEYDSPHYSSNVGLRNAVLKVFCKEIEPSAFDNPKKRPDLLIRADSTLCAVATEDFDPETNVAAFRRILLIELKMGGFSIGRKEMDQASGYVEDLLGSGLIDGRRHARGIMAQRVGSTNEPVSFIGTVREVDLDASRFEIRNVEGQADHVRCAHELEEADVKRLVDKRVRVKGTPEYGAGKTVRLLWVDEVELLD
jgi:hypothetical protein